MFESSHRPLPKPQKLRQRTDRDCGVVVFAELAGATYEEVLQDLPGAERGTISVTGWMDWLRFRGLEPQKLDGARTDLLPVAHLVAPEFMLSESDAHWVYRDKDGHIHDPAPTFQFMPADDERMRTLMFYKRHICTISVTKPK